MLKQHEMLKQVFFLIAKSDLFPETSSADIAKDVLALHKNGYLFASADENDIVRFVACMYRVKKVPKRYPKKYPVKSIGDILYVAWAISKDNDKDVIKRLLTSYLDTNKDIKTISFHELRDGEKLKTFNRKEEPIKKEKKAKVNAKKDVAKPKNKKKETKTRVKVKGGPDGQK